jgi:hypothetical protein
MKKQNSIALFFILTLLSSGALLACERSKASSDKSTNEKALAAQSSALSQENTKITKIIFVGKQYPCDCTRTRIENSWAALQEALGTTSRLPVQKLQSDTEDSKVWPYQQQKPIVTLPAIYFLDKTDNVIELLQGEVTKEQIAGVLNAKRSAL